MNSAIDMFITIGVDDQATVRQMASGGGFVVQTRAVPLYFFDAIPSEAQAIADAINAAIEGAKARAIVPKAAE